MKKSKKKTIRSISPKKFYLLIDTISFIQIFLVWLGVVTGFSFIYQFLSTESSSLIITTTGEQVINIFDSLYFSFVSATTTGFGDIIPTGYFRLLSSFEVIISLLVIAVVTSKLISLKQNVILDELYEITFTERVSRMRSSLLLFRQNIHILTHKVEDSLVNKRDVANLHQQLSTFKETIEDITHILMRKNKEFLKQIDNVDVELITNSINHSFQRIINLLRAFELNNCHWKIDKNIFFLDKAMLAYDDYYKQLKKEKLLTTDSLSDFSEEKNRQLETLRELLGEEVKIV